MRCDALSPSQCVGWWGAVVSAEARDAARGARVLHASLSAGRFLSPMTQVLTLQLYISHYDLFPPIVSLSQFIGTKSLQLKPYVHVCV